ncbi:LacI family transcriptional regulator [Pelagibius litoralis]|uniref:LacI family transcriptional regulator n=1 Tax=Pelagibius litoralis TaxID=374515 RepID=A0A967F0I6_9PROT|nr:LacI family DNA-binding transcriptional regulator [Pelagibius litoralis]NIA70871.1 LacI family transcriptional regulator [Pelagibius litoralis]
MSVKNARLQEVARAAGVSYITAWRALNDPDLVSEKTRAKVSRAVEDTGYLPNAVARSLVSASSGVIGAIVPTLEDSIFADTIQGVADVLHSAGQELLVGLSSYDSRREAELIRAFMGRQIDGLILTGRNHEADVQRLLKSGRAAVVEVWDYGEPAIDMLVGFSNTEMARAVTAFLCTKGYRHIAFVTVSGRRRGRERLAGYRKELAARNLSIDPALEITCAPTLSGGGDALDHLMALDRPPDAIFFNGDTIAIGAHLRGRAKGLTYPADVALVGVHDLEIARHVDPPLTSVRIPRYRIGEQAAKLLLARGQGKSDAPEKQNLGFEIVERGTT